MDNFWWGLIAAMIYIPLLVLWIYVVVDVFTRRDLSGLGKVAWIFAVLVLPFFGTLIYLIARPSPIEEAAGAAERQGVSLSTADELERLSMLHDKGKLSDAEFARLKSQVTGGVA
jgi:hypothetical protein